MTNMKKKGRNVGGGGMMSSKEKLIVRFIVERLENAYRNANGKAEYARNMDQVMKDIFGVKKFTKTLERAHYSESAMSNLMRRMDTKTLWAICRNTEHYQMLVTLIALDSEIVKLNKKRDKILNLEPSSRPSGKYKKLTKELKKVTKTYNQCIKMFRNIFDIHKTDGSPNQLIDMASSWKERYGGDGFGDIFYGDDIFSDLDDGFSTMESMDSFVRSEMQKRRGGGRSHSNGGGILGLFNDGDRFGDDPFDDDPDIDEEGDDPSIRISEVMRTLETLGITPEAIATMQGKKPVTRRGPAPSSRGVASAMEREFEFGFGDDGDEDMDNEVAELRRSVLSVQQTVVNQSELLTKLVGALAGNAEDDDEDNIPLSYPNYQPQQAPVSAVPTQITQLTSLDVIQMSNEAARSAHAIEADDRSIQTPTKVIRPNMGGVNAPPVAGVEVNSPEADS